MELADISLLELIKYSYIFLVENKNANSSQWFFDIQRKEALAQAWCAQWNNIIDFHILMTYNA